VDEGFLFTFQLIAMISKDQGETHPFTVLDISVTKICIRLIPSNRQTNSTTYSQTEAVETLTRIDLFTDTAATLDSIVSDIYYGMLRGQIHTNLPPEHPIITI